MLSVNHHHSVLSIYHYPLMQTLQCDLFVSTSVFCKTTNKLSTKHPQLMSPKIGSQQQECDIVPSKVTDQY